jgi:hypothetical protein
VPANDDYELIVWERHDFEWFKLLLAFAAGHSVVGRSWDLQIVRRDDQRLAGSWQGDDAFRELLERDLTRFDTADFEDRWTSHLVGSAPCPSVHTRWL